MKDKRSISISIYFDNRRPLKSGKYPVKLKVYFKGKDTRKYYPLGYDMTEKEFKLVWESANPKGANAIMKDTLNAILARAKEIAEKLEPFLLEKFELEMFGARFDKSNIIEYYQHTIDTLKESGQIATASNYSLALKSITKFLATTKGKNPQKISFFEITPELLSKYENFMIVESGKSRTTVSMYIRTLRTIYNTAIRKKEIDSSLYPFGKDRYQPPAAKSVKKALSDIELKQLFEGEPQNEFQAKAKAFWFFSFSCNGMNIKDILNLRFKDLQSDSLSFYRAKTINTNKANLTPVIVPLTSFAKQVVEQYANTDQAPTDFIFPFIDRNQPKEKQHLQNQNFTRFINQHFKKYAASLGITSEISTYWARHSFATRAIRNGASLEFVSEALSHSNLQTTKGYFAGFENEQKREFAETLMKF